MDRRGPCRIAPPVRLPWTPPPVPRPRLPAALRLLLVLALALSTGLVGDGSRPALVADDDLDPIFEAGGKVTTDFNDRDFGTALVLQPDGKLVAAGSSSDQVDRDFALARYGREGQAARVVRPRQTIERIYLFGV